MNKTKYIEFNPALTPENFWDKYSREINNNFKAQHFEEYQRDFSHFYTKEITKTALAVIKCFSNDKRWIADTEYFRIDAIGYVTHYSDYEEDKQEHWILKVAYEHESGKHWDDELCKLCNVNADLKVLSAYADIDKVEIIIQKRINRLAESNLIFRNTCKWLFVFGPRRNHKKEFRAFTIDKNKVIHELTHEFGVKIIPNEWGNKK